MTDALAARDVEALRVAVAAGATPKFVHFWGHTPRGGAAVGEWVLSQWWPQAFVVEGQTYPTAEHWMMAGKARLFGDHEVLAEILAADDPGKIKALGRKVRGFDGPTWDAHRVQIVTEGNVHKFGQHEELRAYLSSTVGRVLVEASPRDRIWGIGLGRDHADADRPAGWRGLNLLGFALMDVRDRLAATSPSS